MDGQHLGAIRVSGELMRDHFFRTTRPGVWIRTDAGIPSDAEFVRGYEDGARNEFVFVYRHPSFPLIRPGEPMTFIDSPLFSALHLTLPLRPDTAEFLTGLIAEQVERERKATPPTPTERLQAILDRSTPEMRADAAHVAREGQ